MELRIQYVQAVTPAGVSTFFCGLPQFRLPASVAPFRCPAYTRFSYLSLMIGLQTLRAEFRPTLQLALPLVLAELGWMSMAIVDTTMVGRLPSSAVAISAVSLGGILVHVLAFFGGGLLIGLDTLVSQAFGAGQREDCHRSLVHGIYLSLALTPHPYGTSLVLRSPASFRAHLTGHHFRGRALLQGNGLGHVATFALFRSTALHAGHEHGSPHLVCAGDREHHQRRWQLASNLWKAWCACDGR